MCYNVNMNEGTDRKTPISMRISSEGGEIMDALAKKLGVNRTSVVEMAIRRMAEQENVTVSSSTIKKK